MQLMDAPSDDAILFSICASAETYGDGSFTEATMGTITFDRGALTVGCFLWSYRLPWTEIDCIKQRLGGVEIRHHSPNSPKLIVAQRFRLFKKLQDAVRQHQINVNMEA